MATLTWHGHSCFTLEHDGTRILIDPWIAENPAADIKPGDVGKIDYILVSHGHFDHFADCIPIAKRPAPPWSPPSSWCRSARRRE